jgi:Protein similar to CwfJ C-terminus 1
MTEGCVYCLENHELCEDQILLRGENLYLCAPLGQIIEGYLAIAPYRCIGSCSRLPATWLPELQWLHATVLAFYQKAYSVAAATFYEQGRAGGGASRDQAFGFPFHAHLCSLPLPVDLGAVLGPELDRRAVAGLQDLSAAAQGQPYLYVETPGEAAVYLARSAEGRAALATMRLKPAIATLVGCPERGNWRAYPGEAELQRVKKHWWTYSRGGLRGAAC